jgi:16S rRNA (cytosine1402-N4)-methyltransferase
VPILLAEILAAFEPLEGRTVLDLTAGFGGHSEALLQRVGPTGRLIALDLDGEHLEAVRARLSAVGHPFELRQTNFAAADRALAELGLAGVDRVLGDLGMSSMQVDSAERGFSFMRDGPLDMRMDRTRGQPASSLLATISRRELALALRDLGDEPEPLRFTDAILAARKVEPITGTRQLAGIILAEATRDSGSEGIRPGRRRSVARPAGRGGPAPNKRNRLPVTRVFQTLRILVNREFANLDRLLTVLPTLLNPGGVAGLISFHSGEDRRVKRAFRAALRAGQFGEVSEEPVRPGERERMENPRSRSAKLRIARRSSGPITSVSVEPNDPPAR